MTRTGSTSGAATVDYATSDGAGLNQCNQVTGLASARCDYETTLGTLRFAAGETSKQILIPIIDDSYAEGTETFSITLSNPTGITLGSPSTVTVTITDNETTTGVNPIDQAGVFARLHYLDFLNREPDASGLAFWTNEITSCGANTQCIEVKRINVSAAFFLSIEFQQTGYLVERIYKAAYGDANGNSTFSKRISIFLSSAVHSPFNSRSISRTIVSPCCSAKFTLGRGFGLASAPHPIDTSAVTPGCDRSMNSCAAPAQSPWILLKSPPNVVQ